MRVIKFRIWDKRLEENVMYQDSGHFYITADGEVYCVNEEIDISKDVELMQYTGLDDLNGVEVYAGDIVKCITFDGVSFNGEIYFDKNRYAYSVRNVETLDRYPLYAVVSCVVIGNKFEHPHLLEEGANPCN